MEKARETLENWTVASIAYLAALIVLIAVGTSAVFGHILRVIRH